MGSLDGNKKKNKVKHILSTSHLQLLYQTLIEPYLTYCFIIWASPEKNTILESLHKLQKRAVRIIANMLVTEPTQNHYSIN